MCIQYNCSQTHYKYFNSYQINYANVAYDMLTYNMESATLTTDSNSKWCHCHHMYWANAIITYSVDLTTVQAKGQHKPIVNTRESPLSMVIEVADTVVILKW